MDPGLGVVTEGSGCGQHDFDTKTRRKSCLWVPFGQSDSGSGVEVQQGLPTEDAFILGVLLPHAQKRVGLSREVVSSALTEPEGPELLGIERSSDMATHRMDAFHCKVVTPGEEMAECTNHGLRAGLISLEGPHDVGLTSPRSRDFFNGT